MIFSSQHKRFFFWSSVVKMHPCGDGNGGSLMLNGRLRS